MTPDTDRPAQLTRMIIHVEKFATWSNKKMTYIRQAWCGKIISDKMFYSHLASDGTCARCMKAYPYEQ